MTSEAGAPVMWVPPVVINPFPDESPGGLLIRHCQANGWPALRDFASQQGLSPTKVRWGDDLGRIESNLGLDVDALSYLQRFKTSVTTTLLGQRFPLCRLDATRRRICHACVVETGYQKQLWELSFIDRCPVHHRQLSDRCGCGRLLSWLDARVDRCDRCETAPVTLPVSTIAPSPFQQWFVNRLDGADGAPPMIAPFTTAEAVDAVENIGLLAMGGYRAGLASTWTLGVDPALVMDLGFRAVHDGLGGAISACVREYQHQSGIYVPTAPASALGWFGTWLVQSDLPVDHPLLEEVRSCLSVALGWPVTDLNRSDFVSLRELAVNRRMSTTDVENSAQESGYAIHGSGLSACVSIDYALTVPAIGRKRRAQRA